MNKILYMVFFAVGVLAGCDQPKEEKKDVFSQPYTEQIPRIEEGKSERQFVLPKQGQESSK